MPLQLTSGHLSKTTTGHLSKCANCPGLGDIDWYVTPCTPTFSRTPWNASTGFIGTSLNVGTLSVGTNTISYSNYTASMLYEYYCNGVLQTSCTVTATFANVKLDVIAASITGGHSFDITLRADVSSNDCSTGSFAVTNQVIYNSGTTLTPNGVAATCVDGVYAAGTYHHWNISRGILLCDGINNGGDGYYLNINSLKNDAADFWVTSAAQAPSC